jgi:hypothetical protein
VLLEKSSATIGFASGGGNAEMRSG